MRLMKETGLTKQYKDAQKKAYERDARIHQAPVSKMELEALLQRRKVPVKTHNLTPDGATQQNVNHEINSENERRINYVQKRLDRQRNKLTRDFSRSR